MDLYELLSKKNTSHIKNRKNKKRLYKKDYYKWVRTESNYHIICSSVNEYKQIQKTEDGICYYNLDENGHWILKNCSFYDFWKETRSKRNRFFLVENEK